MLPLPPCIANAGIATFQCIGRARWNPCYLKLCIPWTIRLSLLRHCFSKNVWPKVKRSPRSRDRTCAIYCITKSLYSISKVSLWGDHSIACCNLGGQLNIYNMTVELERFKVCEVTPLVVPPTSEHAEHPRIPNVHLIDQTINDQFCREF